MPRVASQNGEATEGVGRAGRGARALAVLVAVLPLAMDPGGWFPYVSLRWAVVIGAAGLGLVALLATAGRDGLGRLARVPAVRWWGALAVVVAVATLAAPAPVVALVGTIDRRMGALSWWAHAALFVCAVAWVRRPADLRAVAHGLVVSTLAVALVTVGQQLGWDFPAHAVNRARPGGPFGNADVLAAFCVLGVVVAVGVALDRRSATGWRTAAMAAAALGVATTAASGARGGWLGLGVAGGVLLVVGSRRAGVPTRQRVAGLVVALAVLLGVLAASGTLGRTLHVLDGTARGRVDTWVVAVDAVGERPVVGWGPEGLAEGFQRHVDDAYEQRYTRRLLPDRAHTAPLDVAGTLGLVGLAAWLGALVATARGARRGVRRDGGWIGLSVAAAVVGLVVCELSLFATFDVDALAWILAGALVGLGLDPARAPTRPPTPNMRTNPGSRPGFVRMFGGVAAGGLAIGLGVLALGVLALSGVRADRAARESADALSLGRPAAALVAARSALAHEPGQTMPALLLAEAAIATGDPTTIRSAIDEVEATRLRSIDDGRLVLAEGRLLDACDGRCESARPRVQRLADDLLARDPARSDGWRLRAQLAEARGDRATAEAARRRVVDLAPGDDRPWRELARSLDLLGDRAGAIEAARRAVVLDPGDDANLRVLTDVTGGLAGT